MTENLKDTCEEFLHLDYVLDELHHYSNYDLEKVRYKYCTVILELKEDVENVINQEWFKQALINDKMVVENDL